MTRNILTSLLLLCALFVGHKGFSQSQGAIDEKTLSEYFAKNHIVAKKTPAGVYYVITQKGSGANAKAGDNVSMNYRGFFLDGKVFDGNVDASYKPVAGRQPLNFQLGVGQVIKGWDDGIQVLNPGARGTIYIPSGMAYGPSGRGPIPPNTILAFDVELLGIAK